MKSDVVYLHHILEAISRIERYVHGKTFEEFLRNELLQDGVIRQLSIIGEAARRVSEDLQQVYPADTPSSTNTSPPSLPGHWGYLRSRSPTSGPRTPEMPGGWPRPLSSPTCFHGPRRSPHERS